MLRSSSPNDNGRQSGIWAVRQAARTISLPALALLAGLLLLQSGCLFRHKAPAAAVETQPSAIRVALLPLNAAAGTTDTRWLSLAAPIMLARASEDAPELEIVPLWESMPVAIQSLGESRAIGPDQAGNIAGLLTAKWATVGEFTTVKGSVTILVDFMPSKETMIPFRYQKQTDIDSLQGIFGDALVQFVRYQIAKPSVLEASDDKIAQLRELAHAIDLEYGWFVPADPGKSDTVVSTLAKSDYRLAQVLFNPNLYPAIARAAKEPRAKKAVKPGRRSTAKKPVIRW